MVKALTWPATGHSSLAPWVGTLSNLGRSVRAGLGTVLSARGGGRRQPGELVSHLFLS